MWRKHYTIVLVFLLVLASVAGTGPERVLCAGQDGHVVIELSLNGMCSDGHQPPSGVVTAQLDANHCGPCVDIPLLLQEATQVYRSGDGPVARSIILLSAAHTGFAIPQGADTPHGGIPLSNSSLFPTTGQVVLRI